MRFYDFIAEMAFNQNEAISKIEVQISPLIQHIVKCWAMPKSRDYKHWVDEITNILDKIDNFGNTKTKSGRIAAKVLKKEYKWYSEENTLNKKIANVEIQYRIKIEDSQKEIFVKELQNFLNDFWEDMANDKVNALKILNSLNIKV